MARISTLRYTNLAHCAGIHPAKNTETNPKFNFARTNFEILKKIKNHTKCKEKSSIKKKKIEAITCQILNGAM